MICRGEAFILKTPESSIESIRSRKPQLFKYNFALVSTKVSF